MNQDTGENIILIGFMGSGKTTIGKKLAKILAYKWIDLDYMIEKETSLTISTLFQQKGEPYFRTQETKMLEKALKETNYVISTGGGIIGKQVNRSLLQKKCCIYLQWEFDTLYNRIARDTKRPLVKTYIELKELLATREAYYNACSQYKIWCEGKSMLQIVEEIKEIREARQ